MWTDSVSTGQLLEVACDESGYEGENHIGATTDVFAHASVRLSAELATNCVQEIRKRIRSPALEYKSNHLLREKHRSVLKWLLEPSGPIHGIAHVHLTDKTFFVVGKVIDLLLGKVIYEPGSGLYQDQQAKAMAVTLYRDGQRTFGRAEPGRRNHGAALAGQAPRGLVSGVAARQPEDDSGARPPGSGHSSGRRLLG